MAASATGGVLADAPSNCRNQSTVMYSIIMSLYVLPVFNIAIIVQLSKGLCAVAVCLF